VIKPNFFIVGAPKSGTTAMNNYLTRHPDVFMATKEIHYFGSDLKLKQRPTKQEYLAHFKDAQNKKITGEASVWYLYSKNAANEIKQFAPNAKILIMLRNPVQFLHSLHSQHLYDGNEDVQDFETAINLDDERKKGNRLPSSLDFFELPPYIDSALFAQQVKRYYDVFGKENVKVILYDDFVKDTAAQVAGTFSFLGLENKTIGDLKVINPNKQTRFFFLHRLIKNPSATLKKLVRTILPFKALRYRIMYILLNWNVRFRKRSEMNEQLRARLKNVFAENIKFLSEIINRDLSAWL
jgi:hypothetical protein